MLADGLKRKIVDALDTDPLVELAQALVRHRSYTGSAGEGDLAKFLHARLTLLGYEAELQPVDEGRWNVVARLRGAGGGPSLMFNGHMDTNPEVLGWTVDPFGGVVRDGRLYGVGICNMKGADAAYVAAVEALRRAGIRLKGDVVLAFVVGEQQGGVGTLKLLEAGVRTDLFLDGEPCDLTILTLHAGVVALKIHVIGRMRHLSKQEEGINAVEKMYGVIQRLKRLRFTVEPKPEYLGLQRLNVSAIKGGMGRDYMDWRTGIVPDFCTIYVDVRIAPGQTDRTVLADLEGMLREMTREDPDLKWEVELIGLPKRHFFPPFEIDPKHPFVGIVADAHRYVTGKAPEIGDVAPWKFYGTDAAHLWGRARIPGVVYGPGGKLSTRPDEAMELDELFAVARVYALTAAETCGVTDA